ncbi:patatin family protein [bacterium]|nr:patatin family protein [bacterium]
MKLGLVMEGGAMRGMFTAGVMDVLLKNNIEFDGGIGTSAGAAFGCNYKSRQIGRVIRYNLKVCRDWRFASWRSWIQTGDLYGAEFCYHTVPEIIDPFDCATYATNPMTFYAVCTDVVTGQPVYKECPEINSSILEWIRASASMPLVSRIVEIDGYKLLDGGMSDSIPLRAFEDMGYSRNLVILTRPAGYIKKANPLMWLIKYIYRRYPNLVEIMRNRHKIYNEQTAYVAQREREGAAFVLRPPQPLPVGPVEHRAERIQKAYDMGVQTAEASLSEIKRFIGSVRE